MLSLRSYRMRLRKNIAKELMMHDLTDRRRANKGWGVFVHETRNESVAVLFKPTAQMSVGLEAWDDPFVNVHALIFQTSEIDKRSRMVQFSPNVNGENVSEILESGVFAPLTHSGLRHRFCLVRRNVRDALGVAPDVQREPKI